MAAWFCGKQEEKSAKFAVQTESFMKIFLIHFRNLFEGLL